ncbi:secreted protein [Rhodopirellula maiorica SM1]|uniref:Secreted protein n=1 Tax=Rhodopirellula maiorica SM1 TaxID=1265738 RepID=M5RG97_9BACT|nr:cellulase family glycosylhydrolase [Rhodopirellula maiorica]EMI18345.1 secreted protein [Rhodopirellula maiorica SM1]
MQLRITLVLAFLMSSLCTSFADDSAMPLPIRDNQGRQIVAGGFVTITEDLKGTVRYSADDYRRMVQMGANFQVIRTALGRLGGWPGQEEDPNYLQQLDEMVRMARDAGLQTIFKLVVYDIRPFGHPQWDAIYQNTNGAQDKLLNAWSKLWIRYKDDPSVFGYDILNEPQRGLDSNLQRCFQEQLLPTQRRLVDAMQAISPDKWALYQPLYRETGAGTGPFLPMTVPFGRNRVIYAPHLYQMNLDRMRKTLRRYEREAAISDAPLLLGEWGPATDIAADSDVVMQERYTNVYRATATELDQHGIGAIKAWFCGSRVELRSKTRREPFTWAIFSDKSAVGNVERNYITDVLARPRPLAIAGDLKDCQFDFDSRVLEVKLKPDEASGSSEIFVPRDRFYANGFRVEIGSEVVLEVKPDESQLSTSSVNNTPIDTDAPTDMDVKRREQARHLHWDADLQRLVIKKWVLDVPVVTLRITPLA